MEGQFCDCQKPFRGLLWCELWLLSLGWRDSHIQQGSEEDIALHLKTCLCAKRHFCHEHTCLQGVSFRDSTVKWSHEGRHRRTAKSSSCDSLCSLGLRKSASSSFLTRFVCLFNSKLHIYKQKSCVPSVKAAVLLHCLSRRQLRRTS